MQLSINDCNITLRGLNIHMFTFTTIHKIQQIYIQKNPVLIYYLMERILYGS